MNKTNKTNKSEKLIIKWEQLGLLFNDPTNKKKKLSKLYERMANYFLRENNNNEHKSEFVPLIFAAIRRMVIELPISHKIDWKNVYDNLIEYWKNYENFKNSNPKIDTEVEYLDQFCVEYVQKIHNNEI